MGIVLFLAAICFVVAAIQLKTDASPPETSNKNTGLTPQNQWNSAAAACHKDLTLSELTRPAKRKKLSDATHSKPKKLIVQHTGEPWRYIDGGRNILERSVFAVERIPTSGIFYYEVKIESKQWFNVYIGLATQQMELNEGVGLAENTYAYDSLGLIWGHEVEGCVPGVNRRPYINKGIPFNDGDVVGCGVDLEKGQIFYTKNGEIVIAGLSVAKLVLFPCVSLTGKGQKIEANFGPHFLFNPAVIEKLRTGLTPQNQWNSVPAACHWQLTLSEREQKSDDATHSKPKQLVVEHTIYIEGRNLKCSVFAVERIPTSGIFYYEVKIESKRWLKVYIGLATEQMELMAGVGLAKRTYSYDSRGNIWGHEVEGCEHGVNRRPYIKGIRSYGDGDVVGCGVDLEKGQIFYTKNGEIVIAGLSVAKFFLFPCVSLTGLGQKIEANFGPHFLFNPAVIEKLRTGLTPQNQWNYAVCHWQLTLSEREQKSDDATHSEPKKLIVQHTGEPWRYIDGINILDRSVFAVEPIPNSGIFYYEVKIERKGGFNVFIGLATKEMEVNEGVGIAERTYSYDSSGNIWGHEVKGCEHGVNDRPYIKEIPSYGDGDGDVVGCGVDLKNGQIFYTKNGEIVIAGLSVAKLPLLPCVSLTGQGQKIEANFGPHFLFKLEKLLNLKTE